MKKIYLLLIVLLIGCTAPPTPEETPLAVNQLLAVEAEPTSNCVTFTLEQVGSDLIFRCNESPGATPTALPSSTATVIPTDTAVVPTETPLPTATNTPTASLEPYAGAPECPPDVHNPRLWHGLWNAELGCHYTHEHHENPHRMDYLFGTDVYIWMNGEISHPWQTFSGALDEFEHPHGGSCMENDCKHEGYKWLIVENRDCSDTPYVTTGANNCITDARVLLHMVFSEVDAVVRFHSIWLEARVCNFGELNCGIYRGGGHLDTGKLNIPRGTYIPLAWNNEPLAWMNEVPEAQPYRIHCAVGGNCLDSWNTEGNQYNYLPTDENGDFRLRVGVGVHVNDGWGGVNPVDSDIYLDCPDFQCDNNNSEAAMFRVWVTIPTALDGSQYDTDGQVNGFFSGSGYTNRYGDIVEGCTEIGLDCIPFESLEVATRRSRFRGELNNTNVEYDISPFFDDGTRDWWIEYPN